MPGYAIDQAAHKNFIYADEATLDNVMEKTFIGFSYNPDNGNLNIVEIDDDSVVYLPQDNILDIDGDYKAWLWTKKNLRFSWDTTAGKKGHLLMEVF